jgi:hypothetical protein
MTTAGQALRMKVELARLAARHGVAPSPPVSVPSAPPSAGPQILAGFASTPHVDLERVRFRPFALGWLPWRMPPLCHRHGAAEVGVITELAYTESGALRICCTVDDDAAKLCNAFSVTATVSDYTLVDTDGPNFYAVVKNGWLDSVSLTPTPANPQALVRFRHRHAAPEFFTLMQRRVACLQGLLEVVRAAQVVPAATATGVPNGGIRQTEHRPPAPTRSRGDFSMLVEQLNARVEA